MKGNSRYLSRAKMLLIAHILLGHTNLFLRPSSSSSSDAPFLFFDRQHQHTQKRKKLHKKIKDRFLQPIIIKKKQAGIQKKRSGRAWEQVI